MLDLSVSDQQKFLNNLRENADALAEFIYTVNPLLAENSEISNLHNWIKDFVRLIMTDPLDLQYALNLGKELEMLVSLQPTDLLKVQQLMQGILLHELSAEAQLAIYQALLPAFSAVISGFYVGKAGRIAAINLSAVSQMGHDLKTPINAITGFSHVILKGIDGPITEFQRQDLTSIHEAGRKLVTMINDLSSIMKQDKSRTGIYDSPFRVSDLLAQVMANIQPYCAAKGDTLIFTLERDLGAMEGDVSKLQWILLCLILYLTHQGPEWQISLRAIRHTKSEPAEMKFQVSWRGCGI